MNLPDRYVGCDVSKLWLDIFDPAEGRVRRIENTPAETRRLASAMAATRAFLVFEATGAYDLDLRTALHAAGAASARINPTTARRYAQATGRKAKTDALDAQVLADLGARLRPDPARPRVRTAPGSLSSPCAATSSWPPARTRSSG